MTISAPVISRDILRTPAALFLTFNFANKKGPEGPYVTRHRRHRPLRPVLGRRGRYDNKVAWHQPILNKDCGRRVIAAMRQVKRRMKLNETEVSSSFIM